MNTEKVVSKQTTVDNDECLNLEFLSYKILKSKVIFISYFNDRALKNLSMCVAKLKSHLEIQSRTSPMKVLE